MYNSVFGQYAEDFANTTAAPIAHIMRGETPSPVFGLTDADNDGYAVVVVIDGCIIQTDGTSFVDLKQANDSYLYKPEIIGDISMRQYEDLARYESEIHALRTIARAYVALCDVRQNERIIFEELHQGSAAGVN